MAYYDVDRRTAGLLPGNDNVTGSFPQGPGEKTASEYIVSGVPFVTGSTSNGTGVHEITFPMLTQWILVSNESDTDMKIGFTSTGVAANQYYTVQADTQTEKLDLRVKSIFVKPGAGSKTYSVMAGLTGVTTGSVINLSTSTYWGV
jgi:hypothetical protein